MRECRGCKHNNGLFCTAWECKPELKEWVKPLMQKYIKVEDIAKVCDPCKDHGVRQYTAREIAEEYARSVRVTKL